MEQQHFFPFVECEHYINLLQDTINRMATNSANCKNWLITLIVGICAVQAAAENVHKFMWIAYIPIGLLYLLDCYYLGIERRLRSVEKVYVEKVLSGSANKNDLYIFDLPKGQKKHHCKFVATIFGMWSFSTTPFYLLIAALIVILQKGFVF